MIRILQGDCIEVMATLDEASVDAIVTDPPYGLGFMDKVWDTFKAGDMPMRRSPQMDSVNAGNSRQGGRQRSTVDYQKRQARDMREFQKWCEEWAGQCLRVLKPGGHLLAFSGTRTYHRMACAIEDAGFEVRDQIGWLYGSGFPKSHNGPWGGTALKPAWEPICMARKSLVGTVAVNFAAHGTGALNIDGCRVPTDENLNGGAYAESGGREVSGSLNASGMNVAGKTAGVPFVQPPGRWPANIIHDGSDEVLAAFPETASGAPGIKRGGNTGAAYGAESRPPGTQMGGFGDSGSAARFFYTAKASAFDRNDGAGKNTHPTVKPTDLMRYLCRLVTPAGGTVLDPFMGSGSTLKAAELEGFNAIGIELDPTYIEIARRRIASDAPLFAEVA